ncbi:hypothetical protein CDL60_09730 [Roseateles noduli]|nr:hypothetical protein CDL60_09730 [Roseateles noduli]
MTDALAPALADSLHAKRVAGMASYRWSAWFAEAVAAPGWHPQARVKLACPPVPSDELAVWLTPWEVHARRVRCLSLDRMDQVEGVPSSLRSWIAHLEVRERLKDGQLNALSPVWDAFPNLSSMLIDAPQLSCPKPRAGDTSLYLLQKSTARLMALAAYDKLRTTLAQKVPPAERQAWDVLDRYVDKFATLDCGSLFQKAERWIVECGPDRPRLPRLMLTLLQNDAAMVRCQDVFLDHRLEDADMLPRVEALLSRLTLDSAAPSAGTG